VLENVATVEEIDRHYTFELMLKANRALDIKNQLQQEAQEKS
jgi:hypothetical protein